MARRRMARETRSGRRPGRRAVLLGGLASLGLFGVQPVHAAKLGSFFEYTVYSKGRVPPEDYKQSVIVALHGFLSAMPNHNYYVLEEAFGATHTVVGFNYDYLDVARNVEEFDAFYEGFLRSRDVVVVGTSLGGFWADYFANRIGAKGLIMVNPVADPAERAAKHLGKHYSKKRDKTVVVTEQTVAAYTALEPATDSEIEALLLLCRDDEVLDFQDAARRYGTRKDTKTVYFDEGGHSLDLARSDVMPLIRAYVEARFAA